MPASIFKPGFFEREDEAPDPAFYAEPRLVTHIDDFAIAAARQLYRELLPSGGAVLDLMSSYRSHLPDDLALARVAGLGLNAAEMRENPQLTEHAVHDVNTEPRLPYADGEFDAAVMTVSVQYLARPVEVFRDVARVLRPGAPFVVTYSNRMFPTKAVRIWRALDGRQRAVLIRAYFREAGGFRDVTAEDRTADSGSYNDPLFGVWAYREPAGGTIAPTSDPV
jgi:SAM-dependent methyltransferase